VKLSNGAFFPVEGVLASDPDKDLAIIKVPGHNLAYLSLQDADAVNVGDHVVAIGSPLGLEGTVSDGLVSAIRDVSGKKWIQTTAPVSHGNSGGPLLDMSDRVVGVVTWGVNLQLGQNLNFAIPSTEVKSILTASASHPQPLDTKGTQATDQVMADQVWTSIKTGHDFKLRTDHDYLYIERLDIPANLKSEGASVRSELKKSPDGKWTGTSYGRLPCETPVRQINWCSTESRIEIDLVSGTRIEGTILNPTKFDCRKCKPEGELKPEAFTWIPK
jgi:S1-C subfamily serine protease